MKDLRAASAERPFFLWFTPGRLPRAAPGAAVVHRRLPRPVRRGLGRVERGDLPAPARVGPAEAGHRAVRAPELGARRGTRLLRRGAAPLRPDDGGLRRLPHPHRRAGAAGARHHRGDGRDRQHDRHRDERQRRVGRGRAEGLVQRAVLLQLRAGEASRRTSSASTTSARPRANNHYPWGWAWAGNTPLKRFKRDTHEGGVADPCIIHWPARLGTEGATCHQYTHAIDVLPTLLELIGIDAPAVINGVEQTPIEGTSASRPRCSTRPAAPTRTSRSTTRCSAHGRCTTTAGRRSCSTRRRCSPTTAPTSSKPFDEDVWELYNVARGLRRGARPRRRAARQGQGDGRALVDRGRALQGAPAQQPPALRRRPAATAGPGTSTSTASARSPRPPRPNLKNRPCAIAAVLDVPPRAT